MKDGWGLATDGKVLYGSDGTSTLYQIDPWTKKVTRKQIVKYQGHQVPQLNELEYINDEVWANVWMTDCIARISPKDGTVLGWVLLHNLREGLLASGAKDIDVLNGIAWDRDGGRIFGKMACNSATKFLGDAGICLFSLHVDDLAMSASDPAAQEIGQRFRETILALGGGKASLEVGIGTWLLDIDFWTLHPLTNTKDAN
nr:glutaminyl-peptide cyclotransferase-like [Ipomoea batatas]